MVAYLSRIGIFKQWIANRAELAGYIPIWDYYFFFFFHFTKHTQRGTYISMQFHKEHYHSKPFEMKMFKELIIINWWLALSAICYTTTSFVQYERLYAQWHDEYKYSISINLKCYTYSSFVEIPLQIRRWIRLIWCTVCFDKIAKSVALHESGDFWIVSGNGCK